MKKILSILMICLLVFLSVPAQAKPNKKPAFNTCREICDEGIVMLKNEGGLPLQENKLNIFGFGGCDNGWYYQGNGSGAGNTSNRIPLYQAFRESGIAINEELAEDYNNYGLTNHVPVTEDPKINYIIRETDTQFVSDRVDKAKEFSNQALIVFSRYGGEGNDLPKFQAKEKINGDKKEIEYKGNRIYSELSEEEAKIVSIVCSKIDNVHILFNCCNPMQMGFIENNPKIKSALYMPMGGNAGAYCVPDVMSGKVNPSGHLTDIVPYDFKTDPTYPNMSYEIDLDDPTKSFDNRYNTKRFKDKPNEYIHYACYEENIYHGYWYYETAFKGKDYEDKVQFPFGYGLSYSSFDWNVVSSSFSEDKVNISVKVKNTSKTAGKDVVQLYVRKPYTQGGIEKPDVQLIGFAKTKLLNENDEDTINFEVNKFDFADYDCYDKNNNNFKGYELDSGQYEYLICSDSHTPKTPSLKETFAGKTYPTDPITNYPIKNLFTTPNSDKHPEGGVCRSIDGSDLNGTGFGLTYLSRADNFKKAIQGYAGLSPVLGTDYDATYKVLPPWNEDVEAPSQGIDDPITIDALKKKDYNAPEWDTLMNKLTVNEMRDLVVKGGFQTIAIDRINKKLSIDKDGPCGFASGVEGSTITPTNFPSDSMVGSTWNYEMAEKFGHAIGNEGVNRLGGIHGCYGPGLDLHRSPLGGRNFEYYSEDPLLSGVMCSYQVSGCLEEGMYCYVKHIAMNDSDMGRNGRYNFATEQTFRQIYAKPFEIIAKGAKAPGASQAHKANAAMGSVDRLGTTRTTGSYNFLTVMLRNEWGFRGSVITDFYQSGNVNDVDEGIRAGNDLMLNGANNCQFDDESSNTYKYYVRQAAKNILYTYINTKTIAGK